MIKRIIREIIFNNNLTRIFYEELRSFYHRVRKLTFFINDIRQTFRDMRWNAKTKCSYWSLSSELLFQYHKLEKGMCMPGKRRFFGYDPAKATLELLGIWRDQGFSIEDPVYKGAIETIHAYRNRIQETPPERGEQLRQLIDLEIFYSKQRTPELQTPVLSSSIISDGVWEAIKDISLARRSVRSFTSKEVDIKLVQRAVSIAQQSPSVCNRQPCRVHMYNDRLVINDLLELQNGNRGFGHTIPTLLILTAEASSYFDASERHEPYVDGGLFAMSLLFGLQAQGLASCCLNWCVEPWQDQIAHERANISNSERVIMYIAVGYPDETALVPRSPRRSIDSVLSLH